MSEDFAGFAGFEKLGLPDFLLRSLQKRGYQTPSPIQAKSIPLLLEGRDILGQAQTGTGKTAAFALPMLARLVEDGSRLPQALILAPTRELAIQVAETIKEYASHMQNVEVAAIYGGQDYRTQLRQLRQGVQIVVGTPGRIMDHINRKTLDLSELKLLVLDEADEMLRMGFIDDVEWILKHLPAERQTALFSATMPPVIRRIATNYLHQPEQITVEMKTAVADTIVQRYWLVKQSQKLNAMLRLMELEAMDAAIVFVRTRSGTTEIAEALEAEGYATAALNGDMPQQLREQTIDRLKRGLLDIVVATDVAARGLDVERITHVFNFDIPYDAEAYVHRIGRTGRAGRVGQAILLVTPAEKRMLRTIERVTRQSLHPSELPSVADINLHRINRLKKRLTKVIAEQDLDFFYKLLRDYQHEHGTDPLHIAAAMAALQHGQKPLLLDEKKDRIATVVDRDHGDGARRPDRGGRERRGPKDSGQPETGMERFRVSVGREHGVRPGNLVGAIANEGGVDSSFIGRINIFDNYSTIDLPEGMSKEVEQSLRKTRVSGQLLNLSRWQDDGSKSEHHRKGPSNKRFRNERSDKRPANKGASRHRSKD